MTTLVPHRVESPHTAGAPPPDDQKRFGEAVLIVFVMILLVAATSIFVVVTNGHQSYTATVTQLTTVDSNTVVATIQVWNDQHQAGRPTCDVELNSSAGAFTGTATVTAGEPIAAGRQATYQVGVMVTTDGATMIDLKSSTVSCH